MPNTVELINLIDATYAVIFDTAAWQAALAALDRVLDAGEAELAGRLLAHLECAALLRT